MKAVTTLELRAHVGQLLDQAAAGERIIVERGGQPLCALVPLADLEKVDPALRLARRLAALDDLRRLARQHPAPDGFDSVVSIRQARDERTHRVAGSGAPAESRPRSRER